MRQTPGILLSGLFLLATIGSTTAFGQTLLFSEDFDGLLPLLGESVNERVGTAIVTVEATAPDTTAIPSVWSATAPGWTVDNNLSTYDGAPTITPGIPGQGLPEYGVDEWQGWSFARTDFWSEKDDQNRSQFGTTTNASGTVAIVDPDEYFDLGSQNDPVNGGYYSSALKSPSFSVEAGEFYGLGFDSSWRAEAFDDSALGDTFVDLNNQSVEIIASFDVGGDIQVVKWNSDKTDAAFFKDAATDENFIADGSRLFFSAPAGATSATLSFNIANAANDWWWAVDNIEVNDLGSVGGTSGQVLFEDFEAVVLGDSVNERLGATAKVTSAPGSAITILGQDYPTTPVPNAFTHTAPAGWNVDTTLDPANEGDNNVGVFEWEQWSFATPEFWTFADTQGREAFTNGTGVVAIADGDEWTDGGAGMTGTTGKLLTVLETPSIDISGLAATDRVLLEFDSGYRAEGGQFITVSAVLDGDTANPLVLLSRDGDSGNFLNEAVSIEFHPAGASSVQFVFDYEGGNNWWWAIDNVRVSAVPEPSALWLVGLALLGGVARRCRR